VVAGLLLASSSAYAQTKTSKVTAAVVSVDKDAKTITFKTDDNKEWTLPAEGTAVDALKEVKAGDRVEVTCRLSDTGDYQAVTEIAKVKPKGESKP
jgi:Cu/Ag efflux protein CusF